MIVLWMAQWALASAVVAGAACMVERVLETSGGPRRSAWLGAAGLALLLPLVGAWLPGMPAVIDAVAVGRFRIEAGGALPVAFERGVTNGFSGDGIAVIAWSVAALLSAVVYVSAWIRLARARRRWRPELLLDAAVLVAPTAGPAAVGVLRPSIVVPEWLLSADERVQRLVVMHEVEHVNARDHVILALAPLMLVLAPWNPAFWFMLRRLRLAIELDCDRRVLRRGIEAGTYGSLLIDVAGRATTTLFATSFATQRTNLERRLDKLGLEGPRGRAHVRAVMHGGLALVLILVAGAATPDLPGGSRTDEHIVISALEPGDHFVVDGRTVDAAEYMALDRSTIAQVQVTRASRVGGDDAGTSTLTRVYTKPYVQENGLAIERPDADGLTKQVIDRLRDEGADVYIDDRESTFDAFDALDVSLVRSVMVKQVNGVPGSRSELRVHTRAAAQ